MAVTAECLQKPPESENLLCFVPEEPHCPPPDSSARGQSEKVTLLDALILWMGQWVRRIENQE